MRILDKVLIDAPGAPLKQALLDTGIGEDIWSSFDYERLQPNYSIVAKNTVYQVAFEVELWNLLLIDHRYLNILYLTSLVFLLCPYCHIDRSSNLMDDNIFCGNSDSPHMLNLEYLLDHHLNLHHKKYLENIQIQIKKMNFLSVFKRHYKTLQQMD